jgi:hypothetical protein
LEKKLAVDQFAAVHTAPFGPQSLLSSKMGKSDIKVTKKPDGQIVVRSCGLLLFNKPAGDEHYRFLLMKVCDINPVGWEHVELVANSFLILFANRRESYKACKPMGPSKGPSRRRRGRY